MDKSLGRSAASAYGGAPTHGMAYRILKAVLLSVVLGEIASILALLVFSLAVCKLDIPLLVSDGFLVIAGALGGFVSGYFCGRFLKEKGLLFGAVCGAIFILILFLFNVGFHQATSLPFLLLKLAAVLLCASLGGIFGVNKRAKRIKL